MGKTRKIELSDTGRSNVIVLPVNPVEVSIASTQLNQVVQLLSAGEANLLGEKGLDKCQLDSFFPSPQSPFYRLARYTPAEYVKTLKQWKESKKPIRLIISDMDFNKAMTIDSFSTTQKEGDNDIYYSLSLTEYRELNVPSVKVDTTVKASIKRRPAPAPASRVGSGGTAYTVKSGDTLWGIATKHYGNGAQYTKIYNANKDVIESAAKSHGKASSDNGHWIWPGEALILP